jgi:hypothetical protein
MKTEIRLRDKLLMLVFSRSFFGNFLPRSGWLLMGGHEAPLSPSYPRYVPESVYRKDHKSRSLRIVVRRLRL